MTPKLYVSKAQMQIVEDKTVISGLHSYTSDQYGLITASGVSGVGADFSQTTSTCVHLAYSVYVAVCGRNIVRNLTKRPVL